MHEQMAHHATSIRRALAQAGLNCVAQVIDSDGATDFAVALSPARLAVLRLVLKPTTSDYAAIETMIADGDFARGMLIRSGDDAGYCPGNSEVFHLSEMDEIISRLRELGAGDDAG